MSMRYDTHLGLAVPSLLGMGWTYVKGSDTDFHVDCESIEEDSRRTLRIERTRGHTPFRRTPNGAEKTYPPDGNIPLLPGP